MPIIFHFGLDGNNSTKMIFPFDIKGKGNTKIFSLFDIHCVVHAPPKYRQGLQRHFLKRIA